MDESSTGCDNTVVAVDVMKDDLVNGCDNAGYTGETVCNGSDIVCDERIEDVARDLKDIPQSMYYTSGCIDFFILDYRCSVTKLSILIH